MPKSAWAFPAVSVLFFGVATLVGFGSSFNVTPLDFAFAAALLVILFGTVFAAVYHAEVIAHRTGEPYGTLVLTIAVTVIELALIASIMLGDKPNPALARDTVFAVVMIICNGLVGMCILAGGLRYREQGFRVTGANIYLTVLMVFATLSLVLPNYVHSAQGPVYTTSQLAFVSVVTVVLYGVFLYTQTVRHRDYFIVKDEYDQEVRASTIQPGDRREFPSLARMPRGRRSVGQEVRGGDRRCVTRHRRADGFRRPCRRAADPVAGERRGLGRCATQRIAEEHQPRARFLTRHHRLDDSGGRLWRASCYAKISCSVSTRRTPSC